MGSPAAGTMVHVTWVDSATCYSWLTDEQARAATLTTCQTCGFLVVANDDMVIVALNRCEDENSAKPWGETITIPRVAIKAMKWWSPNHG